MFSLCRRRFGNRALHVGLKCVADEGPLSPRPSRARLPCVCCPAVLCGPVMAQEASVCCLSIGSCAFRPIHRSHGPTARHARLHAPALSSHTPCTEGTGCRRTSLPCSPPARHQGLSAAAHRHRPPAWLHARPRLGAAGAVASLPNACCCVPSWVGHPAQLHARPHQVLQLRCIVVASLLAAAAARATSVGVPSV